MRNIPTLAQAIEARSEELFKDVEEAEVWEVRCVIAEVRNNRTNELVNKEYYNIPIKKLICKQDNPLKIFFEKGGFIVHQIVKSDPEEYDRGFWLSTSTKTWRFDYI